MNIADKVKMEFETAIHTAIEDWKRDHGEQVNLFSRNRKLDKVTMIKLLCLMGGNSLRKGPHDYPDLKVSASSFSERRVAIPYNRGQIAEQATGKMTGAAHRAAARPAFVAIKGATDEWAVAPVHYGAKAVEMFTHLCYNFF